MHKPEFRPLPLKTLAALLLGLTLTACGGGDGGSRLDNINDGNTDGGDTGGGGTGTDTDNEPAQLGSSTADGFVPGQIQVGIGDNTLSPGGTTSLAVSLVNSSGDLVTGTADVTFNSPCVADGGAILSSGGEQNVNTISTTNGRAEITYTANGCAGEDIVTARATYEGASAGTAQATLQIEADTVTAIEFVSATPSVIALQGTGGTETARVTFKVTGQEGAPIRGVPVTFSLSTSAGGIELVGTEGTTNSAGEVSTTVRSGTIATPVSVVASTTNGSTESKTGRSTGLAVGTGVPDQNSTSLGASNPFPIGWLHNGVESEVTIQLADAFNNPAPDGTSVSFTTSGGDIEPNCETSGGSCTVTWKSGNPRPGANLPQVFSFNESTLELECPAELGDRCRPGRVYILAHTSGNESFLDVNGNGFYDGLPDIFTSGDTCERSVPTSSSAARAGTQQNNPTYDDLNAISCDDLGEAYVDQNFNGSKGSAEEYFDFDEDGNYELGDGIYNGALCSDAAQAEGLCNKNGVHIRQNIMLVMSCEQPYTIDGELPGIQDLIVPQGGARSVSMVLADCNGNGLPAGTTVTVQDETENATVSNSLPGELAGSAEFSIYTVTVKADDEEPMSGYINLFVNAPTPGGELTTPVGTISVSNP